MLEKHEPQPNASRTSRVFLKSPKGLYNSTIYEEQVLYFFYKMYRGLRALVLTDVSYVHYILTVHSCDVRRVLPGNIINSS